jgi:hypothetical protein
MWAKMPLEILTDEWEHLHKELQVEAQTTKALI